LWLVTLLYCTFFKLLLWNELSEIVAFCGIGGLKLFCLVPVGLFVDLKLIVLTVIGAILSPKFDNEKSARFR
jgi:hypothetical protein